jgi:meso-butanediol dehydrogenase/(S,S)-butanediol dehydrogenase/diacetyl reductase
VSAVPRFAGRVAIVTGGAAGMGAATVRRLASEGARVFALDRDGPKAAALAETLRAEGLAVEADTADVMDPEAVTAAFGRAIAAAGRLDILVQVAGGSVGGSVERLPLSEWDRIYALNLRSTVHGCRLAAPAMRRSGGGAIVTMASISGLRGDAGWSAYNAAKAAIISFTQSFAWEVGRDRIRVNAICPGPIASPRMIASLTDGDAFVAAYRGAIALGRLGEPEEAAAAIAFLASDDAAFVTGHALVVDGGLTARTGQPVDPIEEPPL